MSGHRPPGPLVMLAIFCLIATIVAPPVAVFLSQHIHSSSPQKAKRLMQVDAVDADARHPRRHHSKHPAGRDRRPSRHD